MQLQVRHVGERFVTRGESEWPIDRTRWTPLYLDAQAKTLVPEPAASANAYGYSALDDGITFCAATVDHDVEVTGPLSAKLWISSETTDADLFLVVRLFDPDGAEVLFEGTVDPRTPIAQGWLRASHRKLDPTKSTPWQPYHTHDEVQPLQPREIYEVDVEIWPTCIVIPAGYRLALTVQGADFDHRLEGVPIGNTGRVMRGVRDVLPR